MTFHIFRVRMHYGHPDVFDRVFHITRGGISKASRVINISEDIYSGFDMINIFVYNRILCEKLQYTCYINVILLAVPLSQFLALYRTIFCFKPPGSSLDNAHSQGKQCWF